MSIRLRAGLLIALSLCSSGIEAAETRVKQLVATPAFELREVAIACDLTIDSPKGAPDRAVDYRYRVRVLGRDAASRWDSGWLRATGLRGRPLRTRPVQVAVQFDSVSAQALAEIWIEVTVEVEGRVETPTRFAFCRWADARYRAFPEPGLWPEAARLSPLADGSSTSSGRAELRPKPRRELGIPSDFQPPLPRVSWGHLKAHYR